MRRTRLSLALLLVLAVVAAACGDDGGDAGPAPADDGGGAEQEVAEPADFSERGPYSVGQVDLQLDSGPVVAVFYPADPAAVPDEAEPYAYSGEDVLDPAISALLPEALYTCSTSNPASLAARHCRWSAETNRWAPETKADPR